MESTELVEESESNNKRSRTIADIANIIETLEAAATSLQATPMQVALAWLLQRSPNALLIPGTSSVEHLRENLKAAALELSANAIAELNGIGGTDAAGQPIS